MLRNSICVLLFASCAFFIRAQDVYHFERLTSGEDYVEFFIQFIPVSESRIAVIFPSWVPDQNIGDLMLVYDENTQQILNDTGYFVDTLNMGTNGVNGGFFDPILHHLLIPHSVNASDVDGRVLSIDAESMQLDTVVDYYHSGFNLFYQGALLSDSNYAFIGHAEIGIDNTDYWLVKVTPKGKVIWEKFFGTSTTDLGKCLCESTDRSLYIGGGSWGYGNHIGTEYENLLIKTDKDGNELWRKHWGEDGSESIVTLNCTNDGGVIAVGGLSPWFEDKNSHYSQPYIAKLDKDGNIEWEFTEPPPDYDFYNEDSGAREFVVARITEEGNIFALGTGPFRDSDQLRGYMPWLYAFDPDGNLLMKRSYESVIDTPNTAIAFDLVQTSDGGFLLGGTYFDENATTQGNHQDAFILKLDERGCEYEDCQPPLSVEEEPRSETDEFTAWPNPFDRTIEFNTLGRSGILAIYDMKGGLMHRIEVKDNGYNTVIDGSFLELGVYIALFSEKSGESNHLVRIIKQ